LLSFSHLPTTAIAAAQALAAITTVTVFGPTAKPALLEKLEGSNVVADKRLSGAEFVELVRATTSTKRVAEMDSSNAAKKRRK
jgi:hypothetical protein